MAARKEFPIWTYSIELWGCVAKKQLTNQSENSVQDTRTNDKGSTVYQKPHNVH